MNKLFKLSQCNVTVKSELSAGLTTFLAMSYIIFLNPVFLSSTGMYSDAVLVATCISAAIGTLLCGILSNKPFALAPGMGMNAFFAYTLCGIHGYSWQQALAITFISGILFLLVVASPVRDKFIDAIPVNLKHSISAGIGLFIALIGLLDAGIITMSSGYPALGDLNNPMVRIALFGLLVTSVLTVLRIKGSLIIGMLSAVVISLLLKQTTLPSQIMSFPDSISKVFMHMDFSLFPENITVSTVITLITLILSMTIVDMFDTLGFIIGTGSRAGMLDKNGNMPDAHKVLIADASATIIGSLCGSSTVTVYAESAAGITAGAKTGLTSVTVSLCFLAAAFFSPVTSIITSAATAPALIIVGLYLFMEIRNVDLSSIDKALPAFLTIIAMPLTYSITSGIAAGFISYVVCTISSGNFKELKPAAIILLIIFIFYFIL